jgi:serine/threonine protein kinase
VLDKVIEVLGQGTYGTIVKCEVIHDKVMNREMSEVIHDKVIHDKVMNREMSEVIHDKVIHDFVMNRDTPEVIYDKVMKDFDKVMKDDDTFEAMLQVTMDEALSHKVTGEVVNDTVTTDKVTTDKVMTSDKVTSDKVTSEEEDKKSKLISDVKDDDKKAEIVNEHKKKKEVALKIIERTTRAEEDAEYEIQILQQLRNTSCIGLKDSFYGDYIHEEDGRKSQYLVEVFDVLFCTVQQRLRMSFRCSVNEIRRVAQQVLIGLQHMHDQGLIHADLKPDNLMYENSDLQDVKIIDFGSIRHKKESACNSIIIARPYRAPEIILGLGWNEKVDIWALGCIIFELYTKQLMFDPRNEIEHLLSIQVRLGLKFSKDMAKKAKDLDETRNAEQAHFLHTRYTFICVFSLILYL